MNDYDALRDYLKKQKLPEFVLSFEQIEEIIDAALPRAAQRASWWETLAQPAGKDAAARGLPCRRLYRDPADRWKERAFQAAQMSCAAAHFAVIKD